MKDRRAAFGDFLFGNQTPPPGSFALSNRTSPFSLARPLVGCESKRPGMRM
ncbi:MAG: hypothetical protein LBH51_06000 [Treponema sp.]|nr:hypothetical protein [Treponema sp.]